MSISEIFIRRPVASILLSLGLFLAGAMAFDAMPIAALPKVDFPIVNVNARLPGADPETMAATVAAPLERRLGAIAGVTELTSTSNEGISNITAMFDFSRDINGAARDVQAAINNSGSDLPVDLPNPPTYRKINPADSPVLILAVTSDLIETTKLYDAIDSVLAQRISQVHGVAQVQIGGGAKPAVRVEINPTILNGAGIEMEQVRSLLTSANMNRPKGVMQSGNQSYALDVNDQLKSASQYAPLILASGKQGTLRLSDVARVTDSSESTRQNGWFGTKKAIPLIITKQPDANVIETVDAIKAMLPQLQEWMPSGTKISILTDNTITIRQSVADVELTLVIAGILVVLVVYFSLGRITPTLAASITLPLTLAGTVACMYLLDYSLNIISLMALTVSVGFIIDDAIVMIENMTHHVEQGDSPIEAAIKGAKEITFTVISITVSLIAVFIPLLFMGGIIGRLFREFAVTLSMAVVISVVISLTVIPSIYALLLQLRGEQRIDHRDHLGERVFRQLQQWYEHGLEWVMRHQRFMLLVMVMTVVATVELYIDIPKGFIPTQDIGLIIGTTEGRTDISSAALAERQVEVNSIVLADPAVANMVSFVGSTGNGPGTTNNQGRIFISLKPLRERKISASQVIDRLRPKLAKIVGINTFLRPGLTITVGGRQSKAQFQFSLSSESLEELRLWVPKLMDALKTLPDITDITSDQDKAATQVKVVVDRDRAAQLGIDMNSVDQVLQDGFAQRQVSTIYKQRNQYHVVMEVAPEHQLGPEALGNVYLKSAGGTLVKLSEIAHLETSSAPLSVQHQGQFPAATLSFNLPIGASLGDATEHIKRVADSIQMPPSIRTGFAGNAQALVDSLKTQPILIISAIICIYLVLGVLYENTLHPLTILSTLPSAGIGALLGLMIAGDDLSIISIIGVILLMGIVKKNGIMLVDYAIAAERRGMASEPAMREACSRRFRPILMTTLASLLGAIPLIVATGNGAELREPLGVAIVGGLVVSQLLTLYTTPVVYLALARLGKRHPHPIERLAT